MFFKNVKNLGIQQTNARNRWKPVRAEATLAAGISTRNQVSANRSDGADAKATRTTSSVNASARCGARTSPDACAVSQTILPPKKFKFTFVCRQSLAYIRLVAQNTIFCKNLFNFCKNLIHFIIFVKI